MKRASRLLQYLPFACSRSALRGNAFPICFMLSSGLFASVFVPISLLYGEELVSRSEPRTVRPVRQQHAPTLELFNAAPRKRAQAVTVRVRMIAAADPRENSYSQPITLDPRLRDLEQKLSKLHFTNFRQLAVTQVDVDVKRRETITLAGGHTLTLRPMYVDDVRVGMWLKWQDEHGAALLDSRMHFDCEEPMLAGTERRDGTGVVLALSARPLR